MHNYAQLIHTKFTRKGVLLTTWFVVLAEEEGNERSCLASHGHTTSLTLDLFDTASGTKLENLVDDAKVMKPHPAQETTK